MSVKIENRALREFLKKSLFEFADVQYGIYDRPGTEKATLGDEEETTVPHEVPIQPAEMMATQLADQRPPVEDEEFVPDNVDELARAADTLTRMVPSDQIATVYVNLQRLVDDSIQQHNDPNKPKKDMQPSESGEEGEENKTMKVEEMRLRKAIRKLLSEAPGWDDDEFATGYDISDGEPDYAAMDDPPVNNEPDGASLDQIADEFGHAGASGARQDIERILRRMRYISEKMGKGEMESLKDFAVQEFIDVMLAGEYIDEDDVTELQQNTSMVKNLDSFRFFFVGAIMMPAYNEIKRNARKKVEEIIADLGLPQGMNQSLLNQALGEVPKNLDKLETKLLKIAVKSGVNDSDELDAMVDKMRDKFPAMEKAAELEGGLLDLAQDRWGRQSKGRRLKGLAQALQSTSDWQELDK